MNLQLGKMGVFCVICGDLDTNTFALFAILIQFPKSLLISSFVDTLHTDIP